LYTLFEPNRRDNFDVQFLRFDESLLSTLAPYEVGDSLSQSFNYPTPQFEGFGLKIAVYALAVMQNLKAEYQILE